jgi:uroporphyrinogen-III synthase
LLALPVYAVGRRTAEAAGEAGFGTVVSADGDADSLVEAIRRHCRPGARILYPAGEHRARDLAGGLAAAGIAVTTAMVYRTAAVQALPEDARTALVTGQIDGVLHFSRRTAAVYLATAAAGGILAQALAPVQFCLSPQVAEPLAAAGAPDIAVAARPREADLVDLVAARNVASKCQ